MKTTMKSAQTTTVALILSLVMAITSNAFAGSATWKSSPSTGDWNTATNWTPQTVPNGSSDTATFATSNQTSVSISADTTVDGIVFNAGASAFTITASSGFLDLNLVGAGVTNNSGTEQNFIAASGAGTINFGNSATAGSNNIFTANGGGQFGEINFSGTSRAGTSSFILNGGSTRHASGAIMSFFDNASADASTIMVNGRQVSGAIFAQLFFQGHSTAGNATLIANDSPIEFLDNSHGGTARVELFGRLGAALSVNLKASVPQLTIGSIEGSGHAFVGLASSTGAGTNLIVGANNLSTTFAGVIEDRGFGGSLTKVGHGKFTLSGANTYTGGTTINKGTLVAKNKTGSATGSGAVQVNLGTLSGTGTISGAVTVGNGTTIGAILLPGTATKPGTLTINNTLTFNSPATYKCVLNRTTPAAGKVTALGVTINSGATFALVDTTTGTLTSGTVFTVINNTSANPIFGTFSNLADGSTFTSGGTTFKASYTGGTGNDLTLTVQ
jgi:autotransporter-associated beta strand protein